MFVDLDARLAEHARTRGASPALIFAGTTLDYAALHAAVERAARVLDARGLRPGERVAVQLGKGSAFVLLHLACLRRGYVTLPLHEDMPSDARAELLADADASLVVLEAPDAAADVPVLVVARDALFDEARGDHAAHAHATQAPRDAHAAPTRYTPRPDDLTALLYTSGTTGRKKGVPLTRANVSASTAALHAAWEWTSADRLLHALPLGHVHGLFVALHGALHAGACVQFLARFDADAVWTELQRGDVTLFMGVPTMYHRLLARAPSAAPDTSRVRLFVSGSAALRPDDAAAFSALTGRMPLQRYGLTETLMVASQSLHGTRRPGSVGRDLPGVTTRIVDPATGAERPDGEIGEIVVRGPSVTPGYWRRPEETAAARTSDGAFRTGDLGRRDEHGELVLVGRIKELIISGGFNVAPQEVESVLDAHPAVAESAVAGLPDEDLGERVVAAVVLRPGIEIDAAALIAAARGHLLPYQVPRAVLFVDALPRNAMGKVVRAEVAALFA